MRKGQISYFILIAIILAIAFSFVYYVHNGYAKLESQVSGVFDKSLEPLKSYVGECIKLSAEESILNTGFQGGFYNETNNSIFYSFFRTPLYSKGHNKLNPPLSKIEEQISLNLEDSIIKCIDDFSIIKEKGISVSFSKPTSKTTILENGILFDVNFPIIVKSGNEFKSFDSFSTTVPSRYKLIYAVSDEISKLLSQQPNKLCVSCLIDYSYKNDLNISATTFNEQSLIITIADKKVKIGNKDFIFNFAHSAGGTLE